jgi:hypothetical protein
MADKYSIAVNFALPRYNIKGRTLEGVFPGEKLDGEIVLKSLCDINCRGVWLEIGYIEKGNGSPHEERMVEVMFHKGTLAKNQIITQGLNFHIPDNAPVSYKGKYFEILWFVRARVDIPMWFDDRKEFHFNVLPFMVNSKEDITPQMISRRRGLS